MGVMWPQAKDTRNAGKNISQERGLGWSLRQGLQKEAALPTSWIWTSGLLNCASPSVWC